MPRCGQPPESALAPPSRLEYVPPTARLGTAAIAQLVEHIIRNDGVGGSNPSCGTNKIKDLRNDQNSDRNQKLTPSEHRGGRLHKRVIKALSLPFDHVITGSIPGCLTKKISE